MKVFIIPLLVFTLLGCSVLENKLNIERQEYLECKPPESTLCIGWKHEK
jgi:uncharacterized lipoprotein NlpE involved in copper resistance